MTTVYFSAKVRLRAVKGESGAGDLRVFAGRKATGLFQRVQHHGF